MRQTLSISLPGKLKREIDALVEREGMSRSEIIRESLKDFIYFRRLRTLQRSMVLKARARGVGSEQDIFDRVS